MFNRGSGLLTRRKAVSLKVVGCMINSQGCRTRCHVMCMSHSNQCVITRTCSHNRVILSTAPLHQEAKNEKWEMLYLNPAVVTPLPKLTQSVTAKRIKSKQSADAAQVCTFSRSEIELIPAWEQSVNIDVRWEEEWFKTNNQVWNPQESLEKASRY